MENAFGTGFLERGEIEEETGDGYRVKSLDRPGVKTPPIRPLIWPRWAAGCNCTECGRPCRRQDDWHTGDKVLFWLWPDGTGVIFGAMPQ